MWNDEFLAVNDCDGNNLNAVKNNVLKTIEDQMTKDGNDETYRYFNTAFGSNEWYDGDAKSDKAKDYLNRFIAMIEDSEVDGDSGYGKAVIDVKNGETLLAGNVQVVFMTADEFLENIKSKSE
jgi:flagellar basal body P-ring protein FlgI